MVFLWACYLPSNTFFFFSHQGNALGGVDIESKGVCWEAQGAKGHFLSCCCYPWHCAVRAYTVYSMHIVLTCSYLHMFITSSVNPHEGCHCRRCSWKLKGGGGGGDLSWGGRERESEDNVNSSALRTVSWNPQLSSQPQSGEADRTQQARPGNTNRLDNALGFWTMRLKLKILPEDVWILKILVLTSFSFKSDTTQGRSISPGSLCVVGEYEILDLNTDTWIVAGHCE